MSIFQLLTIFSLLLSIYSDDTFHKIPLDMNNQNLIPVVPIYIKEYPSLPKLLSLDINSEYSWIFNYNSEKIEDEKDKIYLKYPFYSISGNKIEGTIYLNSDIKINQYNYFEISQINIEIINSGALSINRNLDSNNIINLISFGSNNVKNEKYFGFCLDFTNLNKNKPHLYIGNLQTLNKDISKLKRFPIYEGDSDKEKEKNKIKWSIKLKGLFIGNIDGTLNKEKDKGVNFIDNKKNKGLIIDEPATIETIYNNIYITKEAMLFLIAHYFNDKKDVCVREEIKDEKIYEIKYNCLRNKMQNLNNINLILDNNVTVELTNNDLLNCAINKNLNKDNKDKQDTCEFIIKYHNKIDNYALGLPILRKFKTYFLYNDKSILLENNKDFSHNYLEEKLFSNISRQKKKTIGQTISELFKTTLWISLIFALLACCFYLYDKYYNKNEFENEDEKEKIINRNKYSNL